MLINSPAGNTSYFTPAQFPPSGSVLSSQRDDSSIPLLFKPIKIRGVEFHNRIFVSIHFPLPSLDSPIALPVPPLCMYSADDGMLTPWHIAHLGGIFTRGPSLTFIEATAVSPRGRITPQDSGIWSDKHISPIRAITELAHSQGQKIGIQLAHAGRKASTIAPWLSLAQTADAEHGGWPDDVVGPSALRYSDALPMPRALTKDEIKEIVQEWKDAARRAVEAGVDVIEIHAAHGFLLFSFLSPTSNKRTDEYGGTFENRIRLVLEIVDGIRAVIPDTMPLFLRISSTEYLEETLLAESSWRIEDTVRFAGILAEHGVDLLDCSAGGNNPAQKIASGPQREVAFAYQAHFSAAVRATHGIEGSKTKEGHTSILVAAVGGIRDAHTAEAVLESGQADIIFVGRQFQRDPATVWTFAEQLGVPVKFAHQMEWPFRGRGIVGKAAKAA